MDNYAYKFLQKRQPRISYSIINEKFKIPDVEWAVAT